MPASPRSIDLADALRAAQTIAVVGASSRTTRTSHRIAAYLQDAGYRVIPVNPHVDEVLGETAYPDLQSIPDDLGLDIINVFRRSDKTLGVVQDAVERYGSTEARPLIWTQLGVSSPEAQSLAETKGFPYVADRCIMVDHQRMV